GGGARIGAARAAPNAPPPLRFMMSSTRAPVSFLFSPSSMFALSARMSIRPEPSDVAVVRFGGGLEPLPVDDEDDDDDDDDDDCFSVSAEREKSTVFSLRWPVSFSALVEPPPPPPPPPVALVITSSSPPAFSTLPNRSAPCERPPPTRRAA